MMKRITFGIALVCVAAASAFAGPYEDCVLNGMKGVSGDTAANAVKQACRTKVNEAKKSREAAFGSPMTYSEYTLEYEKKASHNGGWFSQTFKNDSDYKTITYLALEVLDGDYYGYRPADEFGELNWRKERTTTYYYKLALKPKSQIQLMYRKPKTDSWYFNVSAVLGRESKWSDSVSPSGWGDTAKPEARDPLE